jgi:hypothetical protein
MGMRRLLTAMWRRAVGQEPPAGEQQSAVGSPVDRELPDLAPLVNAIDRLHATYERAEQEQRTNNRISWIIGGAAVLVAFAAVGAAAFQWDQMRKSTKLTREAVREATKAAAAATSQSDIARAQLISSQRAYVMALKLVVEPIGPVDSGIARLRVRWENFGNTPPRNLRTSVNFRVRPDLMPKDFIFSDFDEQGRVIQSFAGIPSVIPPRTFTQSTKYVDFPVRFAREVGKTIWVYAWGWAKYRDVFDSPEAYITRFCFGITHMTIQGVNLNLVSAHCRENNCTDKECDKDSVDKSR